MIRYQAEPPNPTSPGPFSVQALSLSPQDVILGPPRGQRWKMPGPPNPQRAAVGASCVDVLLRRRQGAAVLVRSLYACPASAEFTAVTMGLGRREGVCEAARARMYGHAPLLSIRARAAHRSFGTGLVTPRNSRARR